MATTCVVQFENNPSKVIYSGQLLRAVVNLTLTKPTTVHGIYVKLTGNAYAHWRGRRGSHRRGRRSFTRSEKYLDEQFYLLGGTSGETTLQPGTYQYPFQSQLAPELPTSFEGEYGYIRYDVHVVLNNTTMPNEDFEIPFTVIKAINLNANARLREPVVDRKFRSFYWCCFKSSPLEMAAHIPVGGYVPGQTINLQISINNKSSQSVSDCTVQLVRQMTYHTSANSTRGKRETIIVAEEETHGCAAYQEFVINVNMRVPAVPPTDVTTSNVIKVRYFCRVIGSVGCCYSNPVLKLPLTIGTYPLVDATQARSSSNDMTTLPTVKASSAPRPDNTVVYPAGWKPSAQIQFPNDEPPTYEEAMQYGEKFEGDYVPIYPMFKRETAYSNN